MDSDRRSTFLARYVEGPGKRLSIVCGVLTVAGFFSQHHLILELAAHFRLQYLAAGILLALLFTLRRRPAYIIANLLIASINLYTLLPWFQVPPANPHPAVASLSLLQINVHTSNSQYAAVSELITNSEATVVSLQEVDKEWQYQLARLKSSYPHQYWHPRGDNFGIALLSKLPFTEEELVTLPNSAIPSILVQVDLDGNPVYVLSTHPLPPINKDTLSERNRQLAFLGTRVWQLDAPVVVMGDLNTTPWSHIYRSFTNGRLINVRQGRAIAASWPVQIWPMRIPIDHILVSRVFSVDEVNVGPDIGSDHLPLQARVTLHKTKAIP